MKVLGIVGSPRPGGNTEQLMAHCLGAIEKADLEVELMPLAGKDIRYCDACYDCREGNNCPIADDMYPIYEKMRSADGIILGSPVYSGTATALLLTLLERVGHIEWYVKGGAGLKGKVGGTIVVKGRSGGTMTTSMLNNWLQLMGMVIPPSDTWNIAIGWEKGDVKKDERGMDAVSNFGKSMAELMKRIGKNPIV